MTAVEVAERSVRALWMVSATKSEILVLLVLARKLVANVTEIQCCVGFEMEYLKVVVSNLKKEGFVAAFGKRPAGYALTTKGEDEVKRFLRFVLNGNG